MLQRKREKQLGSLPEVEPFSEMPCVLGRASLSNERECSRGSNNKDESVEVGTLRLARIGELKAELNPERVVMGTHWTLRCVLMPWELSDNLEFCSIMRAFHFLVVNYYFFNLAVIKILHSLKSYLCLSARNNLLGNFSGASH